MPIIKNIKFNKWFANSELKMNYYIVAEYLIDILIKKNHILSEIKFKVIFARLLSFCLDVVPHKIISDNMIGFQICCITMAGIFVE
jgi:hypothetical protein